MMARLDPYLSFFKVAYIRVYGIERNIMRDIKFKAYIKEYDKVIDVDRLCLNWDGSVQEIIVSCKELDGTNEWTDFQAGQFELLEFTGALDSDGNEIYTGYIIEFFQTHTIKSLRGVISEVVWDSCSLTYGVETTTQGFMALSDFREFVVVGNAYKNKDKK